MNLYLTAVKNNQNFTVQQWADIVNQMTGYPDESDEDEAKKLEPISEQIQGERKKMTEIQKRSSKKATTDAPVEYQRRKSRYPWWVKKVDKITTETDDARHSKPDMDLIVYHGIFEAEESQRRIERSKEVVAEAIRNNTPGKSVRDLALHYAANTYQAFTVGSLGDPYMNVQPGIQEIRRSWKLHPPQTLGLPAWKASRQEASHTVEKRASSWVRR